MVTYVLLGETGEFRIPTAAWNDAIALATRYGWEPRGTVRQRGWSGSYITPVGQMVTARDSAQMALALEDAVLDIPEHNARPAAGTRKPSLLEAFSGTARDALQMLVEFLRGGPFLIHVACGKQHRGGG